MKIVIPGGSGQLGQLLKRHFEARGDDVMVLSRTEDAARQQVAWDGKTLSDRWTQHVDGADVVVNLAGRTVNCRYTDENMKQMMASRVDSTRVVGEAIARASRPPKVWLQMSTATIYAHRFDAANDERGGAIGGGEPDVPRYWDFSVDIARAWEQTLDDAAVPSSVRKVAMRTAMVMSPDPDGVFDVLLRLVRLRLGGKNASGKQMVSWMHRDDFCAAVDFLIHRADIDGAVNLCAPHPLSNADFMRGLREAASVRLGLPAAKWMLEIGAVVMRTDTELLLKSRFVVPNRLLEAGFSFAHPTWPEAACDLVRRR